MSSSASPRPHPPHLPTARSIAQEGGWPELQDQPLVLPLEAAGLEAIAAVGGKNASLGELLRDLGSAGVRVPGGFATTARAYGTFLDANQLREPLGACLAALLATIWRPSRRRARPPDPWCWRPAAARAGAGHPPGLPGAR
jgi:hypothetical protein